MFNKPQISFLEKLISCPSITPEDNGAIDCIIHELGEKFKINKLVFSDAEESITNLYAEIGNGPRNLCFAGHSDVVPPGDRKKWLVDPFQLLIRNNIAYGRGMVDMKGAIFAFIIALKKFLSTSPDFNKFKISLLISGNEEGNPKNGMIKLINWLKENNITINDCLIGEPTSKIVIGDTIKIGRRGSITFHLTVYGTQGHVAYPEKAHNPITELVKILNELICIKIDEGNNYFPPSNLEITNIEVDNKVSNVIPSQATATFNIRFNDINSSEELVSLITAKIKQQFLKFDLQVEKSGEAFINKKSVFGEIVQNSILQIKPNINPALSTDGGTSDARFLKDICNTLELGLINETAHKINENSSMSELFDLSLIYNKILENYFYNGMAR